MSNLETIYNGIMDENTAKRNALIAERDEFEKKWLKRTKEFFEKIKFLNDKGFGLYISVKDKKGWSPYPNAKSILIARPETSVPDVRVDEYIKPYEPNWFWTIALRDWKRYIDIMFASLIANILALATIIFSMQVYDRVVPSQSIPTLWVLAAGVVIAALFISIDSVQIALL